MYYNFLRRKNIEPQTIWGILIFIMRLFVTVHSLSSRILVIIRRDSVFDSINPFSFESDYKEFKFFRNLDFAEWV